MVKRQRPFFAKVFWGMPKHPSHQSHQSHGCFAQLGHLEYNRTTPKQHFRCDGSLSHPSPSVTLMRWTLFLPKTAASCCATQRPMQHAPLRAPDAACHSCRPAGSTWLVQLHLSPSRLRGKHATSCRIRRGESMPVAACRGELPRSHQSRSVDACRRGCGESMHVAPVAENRLLIHKRNECVDLRQVHQSMRVVASVAECRAMSPRSRRVDAVPLRSVALESADVPLGHLECGRRLM